MHRNLVCCFVLRFVVPGYVQVVQRFVVLHDKCRCKVTSARACGYAIKSVDASHFGKVLLRSEGAEDWKHDYQCQRAQDRHSPPELKLAERIPPPEIEIETFC